MKVKVKISGRFREVSLQFRYLGYLAKPSPSKVRRSLLVPDRNSEPRWTGPAADAAATSQQGRQQDEGTPAGVPTALVQGPPQRKTLRVSRRRGRFSGTNLAHNTPHQDGQGQRSGLAGGRLPQIRKLAHAAVCCHSSSTRAARGRRARLPAAVVGPSDGPRHLVHLGHRGTWTRCGAAQARDGGALLRARLFGARRASSAAEDHARTG